MSTSVNGWPVLDPGSPALRRWAVPGTIPPRALVLRDGSAGFLLVHLALWWHETLERLDAGTWDEWGHAVRPIRGQTAGYSNHASGTACDLNATRHPLGVPTGRTFTPAQIRRIRRRLKLYGGLIVWGGEWTRADAMHLELAGSLSACERRARLLMLTPRGRRILAENVGARAVILS